MAERRISPKVQMGHCVVLLAKCTCDFRVSIWNTNKMMFYIVHFTSSLINKIWKSLKSSSCLPLHINSTTLGYLWSCFGLWLVLNSLGGPSVVSGYKNNFLDDKRQRVHYFHYLKQRDNMSVKAKMYHELASRVMAWVFITFKRTVVLKISALYQLIAAKT